ncbi:hypothetical protein TNCV_1477921 [Trichonephila clavipes]|nr:hypothetical protein TNCV_1477921 [Trichonephila clavipes]
MPPCEEVRDGPVPISGTGTEKRRALRFWLRMKPICRRSSARIVSGHARGKNAKARYAKHHSWGVTQSRLLPHARLLENFIITLMYIILYMRKI